MTNLAANVASITEKHPFISHCPGFQGTKRLEPVNLSICQNTLAEWFGRPVILLASGRSGLHLYLRMKGFHRYRHRLQVPLYLSRCVINALTPSVFPVELPALGDAILLYHQYGFPQRCQPQGSVVIEDIAHAFFASPHTGARKWQGEVAIFSLPKFFATAGLAGGLVIHNPAVADAIREMVSETPAEPLGLREWMRKVIASAYPGDATASELAFVDSAYELLLRFVSADPCDLAGFPKTLSEIQRIGEERHERVRLFCSFFGARVGPPHFWSDDEALLPFALPYFGSGNLKSLQRASAALKERAVDAGIYHVDVNRNMYHHNYQPCLLLPCHHDIPIEEFEMICQVVRYNDR